MGLFSLEQSRRAYLADFALYGAAVASLAVFLAVATPAPLRLSSALLAVAGFWAWSLIEYGMHRFVLHGVPPFRDWHAQHHRRPAALIGAPNLLSAALIVAFVFPPALALFNPWHALALGLGVLYGYLSYIATHHAVHHWRADGAWMRQRKCRHALHHHGEHPVCYGVTSAFWDQLFGTASPRHPFFPSANANAAQPPHEDPVAVLRTAPRPALWSTAAPSVQPETARQAELPSFADTEATWRTSLFGEDGHEAPSPPDLALWSTQIVALQAATRRR